MSANPDPRFAEVVSLGQLKRIYPQEARHVVAAFVLLVGILTALVAAKSRALLQGQVAARLRIGGGPGWGVGVKRAHDRARPNRFLFLGLIPIIGQFWLVIELGILRGAIGPNKYGPDPTARAHSRLPDALRT